jgi:PAS domain S-box-containing protein
MQLRVKISESSGRTDPSSRCAMPHQKHPSRASKSPGDGGRPASAGYPVADLFRHTFNDAFDLMCLLKPDGTVLEVNRTALRMRKLKSADVCGSPLWLLPWWDISGDTQARVRTAVSEASRGRAIRYEVDLLGSDGAVVTYDLTIKPMNVSDGSSFLLCEARDISDRKRIERALSKAREELELRVQGRTAELAEANDQLKLEVNHRRAAEMALRESEARIRAILETAADSIITIDAMGIVKSFNPTAERMFGFKAAEVIGRNVKMLMPDPYYSEHDGYLSEYQRTGHAKIIGIGREVLGRRKDGVTFPLDLAISEVRLGDQRIFTGIARDISDRKRLEREILEISDQEQLRIGQDLHDGLGQHLTGIALLAKVLSSELMEENSPQAASSGKIAALVQEAIARTRDLAHGLSPVGLEAHGLTPALQELARRTEELPGIQCIFHGDPAVAPGEPAANVHLYRIAQESVNNSIKHGKATKIVIKLTSDGSQGCVSIEDDGIGCAGSRIEHKGMGMRIMAYRSRMIGASLTIRHGAVKGTIVTCLFGSASAATRKSENGQAKKPSNSKHKKSSGAARR